MLLMLFIVSCHTEDFSRTNNERQVVAPTADGPGAYSRSAIEDKSLQEQLDYKKAHLLTISQFISDNLPTVTNHLKDAVYNTPDSLYPLTFDVLTLFEETNLDYSSINGAFEAFEDLDETTWLPSLTIPYKSDPITNGDFETSLPVFAIADYDIGKGEETAVFYKEIEGTLTPTTLEIGENRHFLTMYIDIYGYNPGGNPPPPPANLRLYINKVTPKHYKENWISGRVEVHFSGYKKSYFPPNVGGYCGEAIAGGVACYSPVGKRIKKVKRRHIGDQFNASYTIDNFDTYQNDYVVYYLIFEYDGWPAFKQTTTFSLPNNNSRNIEYRSWNSPYHKATLSMDPNNPYGYPFARTYSYNDSGIEYDLN
ncbi:MAG TPA: hypothetical protein VFM65_03625 [Flavobacteriaceae bacterium]|nr:hypothetical protein [Flavobacteriaceae bacterium]